MLWPFFIAGLSQKLHYLSKVTLAFFPDFRPANLNHGENISHRRLWLHWFSYHS